MSVVLRCILFAGAFISVVCPAIAVDGTMHVYTQTELSNRDAKWGNPFVWDGGVIAKEGGVATLNTGAASPIHRITNNVANLELGGIDFCDTICTFWGESVRLVGNRPFLNKKVKANSPKAHEATGTVISMPIVGDGDATLTVRGGGKLCFDSQNALAGFSTVDVVDGVLAARNTSGPGLSSAFFKLHGALSYQPSTATSGDNAATTFADGGIQCEPGAELTIGKCNAATAKMTVGPITRGARGTLLIRSSSGAGALGSTEKVVTTGAVPTNKCGACAGWIAGRDAVEANAPIHLLKHDVVDGFQPFDGWASGFATSTKDDAVRVATATTLTSDAYAAAVEVDDAAYLVVPAGVTLHLGDGVNPGVLVVNRIGNTEKILAGDGTIDFGDKEGFVWIGGPHGSNSSQSTDVTRLQTRITGSAGVTFVSGGCMDRGWGHVSDNKATSVTAVPPKVPLFIDPSAAGWSGESRVIGLTLRFYCNSFPSGSDVYLLGNSTPGTVCSYTFDYKEFPNALFLCGACYWVDAAKAGGGVTLNDVTLLGDTTFGIEGNVPYVTFKKGISGSGNLTLTGGDTAPTAGVKSYYLMQPSTFAGDVSVSAKYPLYVAEGATTGTGNLTVGGSSSVVFEQGSHAIAGKIDCAGAMKKTEGGSLSLPDGSQIARLETASAVVEIEGDVSVGELRMQGGELSAGAEEAVLTLGADDSNSEVSSAIVDGVGTLSVVKKGSGTLVISGQDVERSWSGCTMVEGGRLALGPQNPLEDTASICYWLDGSMANAFSYDDQNRVARWEARAGIGFSAMADANKPNQTTVVNGLRALYMPGNSKAERGDSSLLQLVGDSSVVQRTVFMAVVPENVANMGGVFGEYGKNKDYTERVNREGVNYGWRASNSASTYITQFGLHVNGKVYDESTSGSYNAPIVDGRTDVLTMVHADNNLGTDTFRPAVGYAGNDGFSGAICEVIAFSRLLTDREIKVVENYLGEKWKNEAFHPVVPEPPAAISEDSDVTLCNKAVLDLGGNEVLLKSLVGEGRIENSADNAAKLTVVGNCELDGAFGAGVDLTTCYGATIGTPTTLPSVEGMAYWLDASRADTVLMNGASVTGWVSRAGTVPLFTSTGSSHPGFTSENEAFHGLPTVDLTDGGHQLCGSVSSKVRTLFFVHYDRSGWTAGGNPYCWGVRDRQVGYFFSRANNDEGKTLHSSCRAFGSYDSYTCYTDMTRLNGAPISVSRDDTDAFSLPASNVPYLLSFSLTEPSINYDRTFTSSIGKCGNAPGRFQSVAEVIAYERSLSLDEMRQVERYLAEKWLNGSGEPVDPVTSFEGNNKLAVSGSEPGAIVIEGDLTLTGKTFAASGMSKAKYRYRVLQVNGQAIGEFDDTTVDRSWKLERIGNVWSVGKGGLIMTFR